MDLLDRLLGHDAWTTRQLLVLCQGLTDEQLDRDFDIGHRTVRATLVHIIHNMEVWSDLMAGREAPADRGAPHQDRSVAALLQRLDGAAANLAGVSRAVARRDGWDERWVDPLDGIEKTYGGAIAHVITHSMHHRAQLLYLLRRLGVQGFARGGRFQLGATSRRDLTVTRPPYGVLVAAALAGLAPSLPVPAGPFSPLAFSSLP